MKEDKKPWNLHYKKEKSVLKYPDENLVRLLNIDFPLLKKPGVMTAVDLGCGSGRHIKLLKDMGIEKIIGLDLSSNALNICSRLYSTWLVQAKNEDLPIKSGLIDIAISWGSLHYGSKESMQKMAAEAYRILRKGGRLFGTLRTDRDTFLRTGKHLGNNRWITDLKDIDSSPVSFYSEEELQDSLNIFIKAEYGLMERSMPGNTGKILSHWYFWAEK